MNDERGYFQINDDICGVIHIAHDAMSGIVSAACLDTEGVSAMSATQQERVRGVLLTENEDHSCTVEVHIIVKMGAVVAEVAKTLQTAVKSALESAVGVTVSAVNVFVAGISLK